MDQSPPPRLDVERPDRLAALVRRSQKREPTADRGLLVAAHRHPELDGADREPETEGLPVHDQEAQVV